MIWHRHVLNRRHRSPVGSGVHGFHVTAEMTPFRVPSTGGTQIGAMWIEQQRAESCRGHGTGEGGQLAAARGGGVAGAELSASQAGVGALSRWGRRCLILNLFLFFSVNNGG